ncbi:MAG: NAD(P)-binding domain-containing protein, partial [Actinomycetota bacterium]|nr:NAD(P)-binding domain-containing protein [Actinomycetota bacterium]
MQLGMIGLGKMGANMVGRLRDAGHEVIGYDVNPGSRDVDTLEELVAALQAPRAVWVMVPAGEPTQQTIAALGELLEAGDLLVDGGNSRFTDDQVNAAALDERGIGFVDCGVSGGVWGRENGYGLMAGGLVENVARLQPIFDALRPRV